GFCRLLFKPPWAWAVCGCRCLTGPLTRFTVLISTCPHPPCSCERHRFRRGDNSAVGLSPKRTGCKLWFSLTSGLPPTSGHVTTTCLFRIGLRRLGKCRRVTRKPSGKLC